MINFYAISLPIILASMPLIAMQKEESARIRYPRKQLLLLSAKGALTDSNSKQLDHFKSIELPATQQGSPVQKTFKKKHTRSIEEQRLEEWLKLRKSSEK